MGEKVRELQRTVVALEEELARCKEEVAKRWDIEAEAHRLATLRSGDADRISSLLKEVEGAKKVQADTEKRHRSELRDTIAKGKLETQSVLEITQKLLDQLKEREKVCEAATARAEALEDEKVQLAMEVIALKRERDKLRDGKALAEQQLAAEREAWGRERDNIMESHKALQDQILDMVAKLSDQLQADAEDRDAERALWINRVAELEHDLYLATHESGGRGSPRTPQGVPRTSPRKTHGAAPKSGRQSGGAQGQPCAIANSAKPPPPPPVSRHLPPPPDLSRLRDLERKLEGAGGRVPLPLLLDLLDEVGRLRNRGAAGPSQQPSSADVSSISMASTGNPCGPSGGSLPPVSEVTTEVVRRILQEMGNTSPST